MRFDLFEVEGSPRASNDLRVTIWRPGFGFRSSVQSEGVALALQLGEPDERTEGMMDLVQHQMNSLKDWSLAVHSVVDYKLLEIDFPHWDRQALLGTKGGNG
jgi:hypothetical protein